MRCGLVCVFLMLAMQVTAETRYKCVWADGLVQYSDTPCPVGAKQYKESVAPQSSTQPSGDGANRVSRASRPAARGKNPACQVSRSKAYDDLLASLQDTYESSYSLIKTLHDSGLADYDELCRIPSNRVNDGILKELTDTYYPSFSLILSLYKSNIEDYRALYKK